MEQVLHYSHIIIAGNNEGRNLGGLTPPSLGRWGKGKLIRR